MFLSYLLVLLLILGINAQYLNIPSVACPNYFQYFIDNSQYIGKISIPNVSNSIELMVSFSQREPLYTNYYGRLSLESRNPVVYRVDFPSRNEVPKVTKITVNGQDICIGNAYPAPSTRIFLVHKITTQPLSSNLPQVFNQQYPIINDILQQNPNTEVQVLPAREVAQYPQNPTTNTAEIQPTREVTQFPQNPNTAVQIQPPRDSGQFSHPSQTFFDKFDSDNPSINQISTQSNQCGESNSFSPLIFGGDQTMPGEFPWLTAIFVKSAGLRFLCGGSLVSSRTVISAGHCFQIGSVTASRVVVNVGRYNLEDFSEQGFVTREIQSLIVHPDYNSKTYPDADLALLQLKQPVQYSNTIRPICIWTENSNPSYIVGQRGLVAGWGADEQGQNFTPVPKKVDTKIVSDSECLRSSSAYNMLTSPRTFCAGNRDDTGPCMGDSGSGLMINRNGKWFLRGIVSAGQTNNRKCNLKEFVVFCDVAQHLQWLQSNIIT